MAQGTENSGQIRTSRRRIWSGVIVLLVAALAVAIWLVRRPKSVTVVHPSRVSMTETIASSARVGGVQEAAVGAQFAGTVEKLLVRDGDRVTAGQPLAMIKNDVSRQQTAQAERAVQTAESQLAQASRGPTQPEMDEAEHQVTEARAQARRAKSDLSIALKDLSRDEQLVDAGIISKAQYDAAQARAASARAAVRSAEAAVKAREARLRLLEETPRKEDVQVARDRLAEAQQALRVARQEVHDATVKAPFAGVVTAVNAEEGQTVGSNGVVDLVSNDLEIRVALDENNLADLAVGQTAIISSSAFSGKSFEGHLAEIGAAVNQERGTIMVKIVSDHPPDWLRPGQTVNVNLITNQHVERLMVPSTAVLRKGDRSVVLVVEKSHALEKTVLTRPTTDQGVPVVAGLVTEDRVIVHPAGINAGDAVRIRR